MHEKESTHSIVLHIKKGVKKYTIDEYATPGFASEFLNSLDPTTNKSTLAFLKQALVNAHQGMLVIKIIRHNCYFG